VVQLPFTLPPLHQAQVAKFLDDIVARDSAGLVSDVRDLIEIAVPDNPRALKRALNVLRLAAELGECAEPGEHEGDVLRGRRRKLAKIILMQVCFPEAYRSVVAQGAFKLRQFQSVSAGANKAAAGEDFLTGRLAKLLRGDDFGKDEADDAENAALMSLTQAVSTAARAAPGPPKAPERQV